MDVKETPQVLNDIRISIELNSKVIDEIVNKYIDKKVYELDMLIAQVKDALSSSEEISISEFESLAMKIPVLCYTTADSLEKMGVRADIAKALEKEKYAKILCAVSGTVKERDMVAIQQSQYESVLAAACKRAYNIIQSKLTYAQDLFTSVKKILTRRIAELDTEE
jgi:hypothetical protein